MARIARAVCLSLAFALAPAPAVVATEPVSVTVYKTPRCGCCTQWADHLRANGFAVRSVDLADLRATKQSAGVPPDLAACHTAIVDGYVIEGHVPASDVQRLLRERPDVLGLAVPDMPIGSPGMEGPNPEPYQVFQFDAQGRVEVFESHVPQAVSPGASRAPVAHR